MLGMPAAMAQGQLMMLVGPGDYVKLSSKCLNPNHTAWE